MAAGQDRPPTAALNAALTRLRTTLAQLTGAGATTRPFLSCAVVPLSVLWTGGEEASSSMRSWSRPANPASAAGFGRTATTGGGGAAAAAARASLDLRRGVDATRQI